MTLDAHSRRRKVVSCTSGGRCPNTARFRRQRLRGGRPGLLPEGARNVSALRVPPVVPRPCAGRPARRIAPRPELFSEQFRERRANGGKRNRQESHDPRSPWTRAPGPSERRSPVPPCRRGAPDARADAAPVRRGFPPLRPEGRSGSAAGRRAARSHCSERVRVVPDHGSAGAADRLLTPVRKQTRVHKSHKNIWGHITPWMAFAHVRGVVPGAFVILP